ncbi:flagellar hook assembly protein FlgD [[Mycobacterium] nativiensis]|uniref:Alpha integrin n=1 Tax=[Mycobacterium] nativiensis TaxID=2855503 RepID=A0ABU5XVM0_9MYCO|nr:hypothetical protein [Mycolicibacter sp. MYC340]MEB3031990.1 hypothetical protein [Mycolicibacter sp. MYC340]
MKRLPVLVTAVAIGAAGLSCPTGTADPALPSCTRPAALISPKVAAPHTDCLAHSSGLNFTVSYWTVPELPKPRAVKVTVRDPGGEVVQTIDELLEPSSPGPVGWQDVDGDGREELIIPIARHLFNGNPNTRFAVWRAPGDRMHFERTQMVGQAVYPSGDGYLVSNGGAVDSRDLTFYLPTGAGYTLVVVLTIEAEEVDPGTRRVLTVSCRAHQEDGLHAVDMDVYQAEDTFCASPAAAAIWPDAQRVTIRPWPRWGS